MPGDLLFKSAKPPLTTYAGLAHYDRLYNCDGRLQSFGGPVYVVTSPFKPALDAENRYTGGGAAPVPKLAGGCGARNGECA